MGSEGYIGNRGTLDLAVGDCGVGKCACSHYAIPS